MSTRHSSHQTERFGVRGPRRCLPIDIERPRLVISEFFKPNTGVAQGMTTAQDQKALRTWWRRGYHRVDSVTMTAGSFIWRAARCTLYCGTREYVWPAC